MKEPSVEQLTLDPITKVDGTITIPGSKSLSNRILLLAALAEGKTKISNLLDSDDISHMLNALKLLGVKWERTGESEVVVVGCAGPLPARDQVELFLGNAGTAMRPLTAALCVGAGQVILTGEPRMYERPIGDLIDALRPLGADIEYLKDENYPPLKINAGALKGGKVSIRGNISSQFLTALLMTAPLLSSPLEIVVEGELVSKPYIDITLDVMSKFGVEVENDNYQSFKVSPATYVSPGVAFVEGDASSASYFLSAAAICGGTVRVYGVGTDSVQGDTQYAHVLEKMGATVNWGPNFIEVTKGDLQGIDVDCNHIPDAAMTIGTTALFAKGPTAIRNIYNWRVKETDRLSAMATELRKVGATVVEGEDFIEIIPPEKILHAEIDTYDDHRIAMCFSLAAMGATPMTINDPKCTSKTFPTYFEVLKTLVKD